MKAHTTNTTALKNITDLITTLMMSECGFDMQTIERCTTIEMQETGLKFRPYFTVLAENLEGYLQTSFDETEDYFFDAINAMNITPSKITLLVKLCIA